MTDEEANEAELWFGPPEKPFRFQGEYDGPPRPTLHTDPARYDYDGVADTPYQDIWVDTYLDRTYSGAPDECGWYFRHGEILKYDDKGDCPRQSEHEEPYA